ncbi:MAG: DUF3822 family protein [Prevotellaceae bacterium]|nr:DUF3822 family protein [Prevotellaceae bacterium]
MPATGSKSLADNILSIRAGADGFSFCGLQGWKHIEEGELRRLLKSDYRQVRLLSDYPSTFIPLDEYRAEHEEVIYRLTFGEGSLKGLSLRHEALPPLDVVALYPVSPGARDTLLSHFPDTTVHGFYAQTLLECHASERREAMASAGSRLYVSTEGSLLFVCAFSGQTLAFANTFNATATADRLYFALSAWRQLRMEEGKDTLLLLGNDSELRQGLQRFIPNLRCVS